MCTWPGEAPRCGNFCLKSPSYLEFGQNSLRDICKPPYNSYVVTKHLG